MDGKVGTASGSVLSQFERTPAGKVALVTKGEVRQLRGLLVLVRTFSLSSAFAGVARMDARSAIVSRCAGRYRLRFGFNRRRIASQSRRRKTKARALICSSVPATIHYDRMVERGGYPST
jgi:hypothetical protein